MLVAVAVAVALAASAEAAERLDAAGLGQGHSLLTGGSARMVFDTISSSEPTPDGRFDVPTGTSFRDRASCGLSASAVLIEDGADYDAFTRDLERVGQEWDPYASALSSASERVRRELLGEARAAIVVLLQCVEFEIRLVPGAATLDDGFLVAARGLPDSLTADNLGEFESFFDRYGTVVVTHGLFGARLGKITFIDNEFVRSFSEEAASARALADFYVSLNSSSTYATLLEDEIGQAYLASTAADPVDLREGPEFVRDTPFEQWAVSIIRSATLLRKSYTPISDIFGRTWGNAELAVKQPAVKAALAALVIKPGCRDLRSAVFDQSATESDESCRSSLRVTREFALNDTLLPDLHAVELGSAALSHCFLTNSGPAGEGRCELVKGAQDPTIPTDPEAAAEDADAWWLVGDREQCGAHCVEVVFSGDAVEPEGEGMAIM